MTANTTSTPDKAQVLSINDLAENNTNFRRVLVTGSDSQLVLMRLNPTEEIGEETHPADQMLFITHGSGISVLDGTKSPIAAGDVVFVPRGTLHNVINTHDDNAMTLFTVYAPPQHAPGTIDLTKADAEAAEAEVN